MTKRNTADCNCKNCSHIERQKRRVIAATRPFGKGVTDVLVEMWNDALERFPCLKQSDDQGSA